MKNLVDIWKDLGELERATLVYWINQCRGWSDRPEIHAGMLPFISLQEALAAAARATPDEFSVGLYYKLKGLLE